MQRRERALEVEPLDAGGSRTELTPLFWQGALGALGALVVAGLVFIILSFSQLTQTLTKLESISSFTDPLKSVPFCTPSTSMEYQFDGGGIPVTWLYPGLSSYIDMSEYSSPKLAALDDDSLGVGAVCITRSKENCEQKSAAAMRVFVGNVAYQLRSNQLSPATLCNPTPHGNPRKLGIVMSALCAATREYPQAYPSDGGGTNSGETHDETHDEVSYRNWPCFQQTGGYSITQNPLCYVDKHKAKQLQIEKDIVLSLVSKLPPQCTLKEVSYAELLKQLCVKIVNN